MDYLIVKSETPVTGCISQIYFRDSEGGGLELYTEASEGRVIGRYSKDSKGTDKAFRRLRGILPRTAVLIIESNITWFSNKEILSILQPVE